jgi:hypothetical protein
MKGLRIADTFSSFCTSMVVSSAGSFSLSWKDGVSTRFIIFVAPNDSREYTFETLAELSFEVELLSLELEFSSIVT